jgi:hypothetical protein
MSHSIHAWLHHGEPRLGIIDTETGSIRQLWRLERLENKQEEPPHVPQAQAGMQQLARELFLISCCESIGRAIHQEADCRQCGQLHECRPVLQHREDTAEQH